ncbi:ABC-2 type transport system permease protein [Sphingomonas sp. UYAg733]
MIARILLVALREFRQIAAARSFWITLLILPAALAVGPYVSRLFDKPGANRIMLIGSDQVTEALRQRFALEEQRRQLLALSRYSERFDLDHTVPGAVWGRHRQWYSDAEVQHFVRDGGANGAIAAMKRTAPAGVPDFDMPLPRIEVVATPATVTATGSAQLDVALRPYFEPASGDRDKALDYAVYVPADFGRPGAVVGLWSDGQPDADLMATVQSVLSRELRLRFLQAAGVDAKTVSIATDQSPAIRVTMSRALHGRERMAISSILPLAAAYLLLTSLMLSGSWMLQGLVEERSNKLLETVLACISPQELLFGKLLGTVALGLTMVATWVACAVAAAFLTHGVAADTIRAALAPLASIQAALAMGYFFIAGYLMVSIIFLTIGAMSDSIRDAQSYLAPIILVIVLPFSLLVRAIIANTGGPAISLMTWIPIYAPFTMLARIGVGVPVWELWGSALLLAGFIAIEFWLLGKVFRASLLRTGQRPGLKAIGEMIMSRSGD